MEQTKETLVTYPLGKSGHVTLDPRRQFGSPCVRLRYPTATLYDMFSAGDSIATVSKWFGLTTEQVEAAVRYEVMLRCKHGRWVLKQSSVQEFG